MPRVTELGYVGLSISQLAQWKAYACEIVGMELIDEGEGDRVYLRMDEWHHRIALHADGRDDLAYLGFRVAGPDEFSAMAEKLTGAPRPTVKARLAELVKRGWLQRHGQGRGAWYEPRT